MAAASRVPGRLRIAVSTKLPTGRVGRIGKAQLSALHGMVALLRELGHEVVARDPDYPAWAMYGHVLPRMLRGRTTMPTPCRTRAAGTSDEAVRSARPPDLRSADRQGSCG